MKTLKLVVEYDESIVNPIKDGSLASSIVCFGKSSYLGSEKFNDEIEFFEFLVREYAKSDEEEFERLSSNYYSDLIDEDSYVTALSAIIGGIDTLCVRRLFKYEHSCIKLNIVPFNCDWDSASIGYAYLDMTNLSEINSKEEGAIAIKRDLELYNMYLNGEVYDFTLIECDSKTGEILNNDFSNYGGFYGDDIRENGMLEVLKSEFDINEEMLNQLLDNGYKTYDYIDRIKPHTFMYV